MPKAKFQPLFDRVDQILERDGLMSPHEKLIAFQAFALMQGRLVENHDTLLSNDVQSSER